VVRSDQDGQGFIPGNGNGIYLFNTAYRMGLRPFNSFVAGLG